MNWNNQNLTTLQKKNDDDDDDDDDDGKINRLFLLFTSILHYQYTISYKKKRVLLVS